MAARADSVASEGIPGEVLAGTSAAVLPDGRRDVPAGFQGDGDRRGIE